MYFFTADLHLGTDEIIERESRPFRNIDEFEDVFVNNVNAVATADDILYVIGDYLTFNNRGGEKFDSTTNFNIVDLKEILRKIKRVVPKAILINGTAEQRAIDDLFNGDFEAMREVVKECGFLDFLPDADIEFKGIKFHLMHHPKDYKKGVLNLFGHTHRSTGLWKPFGLNMGVDLNYFRPFSEDEIMKQLEFKEWWDKDENNLCM